MNTNNLDPGNVLDQLDHALNYLWGEKGGYGLHWHSLPVAPAGNQPRGN
jgi:hypothetical protein